MSKYGKERKVIVIPLTGEDKGETQIFSINGYSVVFRFNEPTTLRARIIDLIKRAVVISRKIDSTFDATTGRTKNDIKVIEQPRYKVIELTEEFKEDKLIEKEKNLNETIEANGQITKELLSEQQREITV